MNLKELYLKFQNSGRENHPAITNQELSQLSDKLEEVRQLFCVWNPLKSSVSMEIDSVERIISARKSI